LAEKGYSTEQLAEIRKLIDAENSDLFDVLAYIAFALAPVTREDRVVDHKDLIFSHYDDKQQAFLDFVLTQYINEGVGELQPEKLPSLLTLKYHGIHDATEELGEVSRIRDLFIGFQRHLYEEREEAS
jgi:type I restriction enzyme R subunit